MSVFVGLYGEIFLILNLAVSRCCFSMASSYITPSTRNKRGSFSSNLSCKSIGPSIGLQDQAWYASRCNSSFLRGLVKLFSQGAATPLGFCGAQYCFWPSSFVMLCSPRRQCTLRASRCSIAGREILCVLRIRAASHTTPGDS